MCQRQYHRGYEYVKDLLNKTVKKYKIPITYIDITHCDGNWEMPHDLLKENHSNSTKIAILKEFDTVLSLNLVREEPKKEEPQAPVIAPEDMWIVEKIEERAAAKKAKNYALADAIRAELLEKGITLVDTKQGTTFKKA